MPLARHILQYLGLFLGVVFGPAVLLLALLLLYRAVGGGVVFVGIVVVCLVSVFVSGS